MIAEQVLNLQKMVEDECSRRCELERKLAIAIKALKDIVKDYDINGSCEEDCVGEYMCHTATQALKEMEGV